MARPEEAEKEDRALRQAGFDPSTTPENALEMLRSLRGKPGVSDSAIARALGQLSIAQAAEMLAEMELGAHGPERREIRRSLFKLRQRGLAPLSAGAGESSSRLPGPELSPLTALLTFMDTAGFRSIWLVKPRRQGGIIRLWGVTSESEGLAAARLSSLTRRELRAERKQFEESAKARFVEADWRLADFMMCEAYRRTPDSKRGQVGDFLTLRAELTGAPPPVEFAHPIYQELPSDEARTQPSADLLKEPEIASWRVAEQELKPFAEEIERIRESALVLNPAQNEERIEAVVARALAALLLEGERAPQARRRLEDIAYYMLRTGRRLQAQWALAAAMMIWEGADLKRSVFFQAFARAQLGALMAEKQERERSEPRLILTPAEVRRAAGRRGR